MTPTRIPIQRSHPIPSPPPELPETGADPAPFLDLSTVALLGKGKRGPSAGWRKWLYVATGRLIDPGESPKVLRHDTLLAQAQTPLLP